VTEYVLEQGKYFGPQLSGEGAWAVLVVDMTNDFGHPDGVYPRHGAMCPSLPGIVGPVREVMEAAHEAGIITIAANQVVYADRSGRAVGAGSILTARPWLEYEGLRPGSWGTQLVDALPRADIAVDKPRASAFFGTPVDTILRGLAASTVVVAGCYTNQCIDATVRDGVALDYEVVVVTDAVTAFDEALHAATLESLKPLSIQLDAASVVQHLRARTRTSPVSVHAH
jgi:ureidoacrylate peracid hydrolase